MKTQMLVVLVVVIAISLIPAVPVYSQEGRGLAFSPGDKTFNVTNKYYTLVFDMQHGARLKAWIDAETGKNYIWCGDYYPSLTHIFMVEEPKTMRNIGNLTVSYPYPLMLEPWSYKVLVQQENLLIVEFYPAKPSSDLLKQTGGLVTYRIVAFYEDKPYIDVRYVLTNPTNETVSLTRIAGKPGGLVEDIAMMPGEGKTALSNWYPVAAYRDGDKAVISVFNISVAGEVGRSAYWVGFINNATHEFAGMVLLEPELTASFGFEDQYYGRPVLRAYIKYGRIDVNPGEPVEIALRVYYGKGNYKWLDEAGFWGLAAKIEPKEYARYRAIADNPLNATSIAEEYGKLKKEVEQLRENNTRLTTEVNELKGLNNKCSIELKDYMKLAERLNKDKASLEMQRYYAFIGGLVAGLVLLYLAFATGALKPRRP